MTGFSQQPLPGRIIGPPKFCMRAAILLAPPGNCADHPCARKCRFAEPDAVRIEARDTPVEDLASFEPGIPASLPVSPISISGGPDICWTAPTGGDAQFLDGYTLFF